MGRAHNVLFLFFLREEHILPGAPAGFLRRVTHSFFWGGGGGGGGLYVMVKVIIFRFVFL